MMDFLSGIVNAIKNVDPFILSMPGPFGKDIPYSQKVAGERKHSDHSRFIAIVVNVVSSYFIFHVEASIFLKILVVLISAFCLLIVLPSESRCEEENTKGHESDDGKLIPPSSFLRSFLFVPIVTVLTITNNILNISETTLIIIVTFVSVWLIFMYVYFDRFANRKKKWKPLSIGLLCCVVGFLVIVLSITMIAMSVYANETIQIFDNEKFEIAVNDVKEAIYTFDFDVLLPFHTNATLFFKYTNEVDGVIIERCTLLEISVYIDSKLVFAKKYSDGVQGVTLEQPVLIQPDKNSTGQLVLYGTSEHRFMGTVTMYIDCISGSGGFNPFDFGSNWPFYTILVFSVGISITAIAIRRRRRGAEEV